MIVSSWCVAVHHIYFKMRPICEFHFLRSSSNETTKKYAMRGYRDNQYNSLAFIQQITYSLALFINPELHGVCIWFNYCMIPDILRLKYLFVVYIYICNFVSDLAVHRSITSNIWRGFANWLSPCLVWMCNNCT